MIDKNKYVQKWLQTVSYSSAGKVSKKDVNRFLVFLAYTQYCQVLTVDKMLLIDKEGHLQNILRGRNENLNIDFTNYYKFQMLSDNLLEIKLPKIVRNMLFTTYGKKAIMKKAIKFITDYLVKAIVDLNQWKTLTDIENYFKWRSYNNVSIKNAKQFFGPYLQFNLDINDILNMRITSYGRPTKVGSIIEFLEKENIIDEVFTSLWEEILQAYEDVQF